MRTPKNIYKILHPKPIKPPKKTKEIAYNSSEEEFICGSPYCKKPFKLCVGCVVCSTCNRKFCNISGLDCVLEACLEWYEQLLKDNLIKIGKYGEEIYPYCDMCDATDDDYKDRFGNYEKGYLGL